MCVKVREQAREVPRAPQERPWAGVRSRGAMRRRRLSGEESRSVKPGHSFQKLL